MVRDSKITVLAQFRQVGSVNTTLSSVSGSLFVGWCGYNYSYCAIQPRIYESIACAIISRCGKLPSSGTQQYGKTYHSLS